MKYDDAFGQALLNCWKEKKEVTYFIERDDGLIENLPAQTYFMEYEQWSEEEKRLIDHISDESLNILDVGAGAGRHALYLQNKGHQVTAIDISEGAIEVCKARGLQDVKRLSALYIDQLDTVFDCVLVMGNNFGIAGSYYQTRQLLKLIYQQTTKTGKVLTSYRDAAATDQQAHLAYHKMNKHLFKPIGQVLIRVRYLHLIDSWFYLYMPTQEEFEDLVTKTGWQLEYDYVDGAMHFVLLKKGI